MFYGSGTSPGWLVAYFDPVSGSILLQVIIAGVLGALGYFYRPILRFFRFLTGRKPPSPAESLSVTVVTDITVHQAGEKPPNPPDRPDAPSPPVT